MDKEILNVIWSSLAQRNGVRIVDLIIALCRCTIRWAISACQYKEFDLWGLAITKCHESVKKYFNICPFKLSQHRKTVLVSFFWGEKSDWISRCNKVKWFLEHIAEICYR
jgi:hypothetical protein